MKANNAGSSASGESPGPAGYRLRDGIGRQVSSKNRSSATFSVGTAQRFQRVNAQHVSPGPGAYTV